MLLGSGMGHGSVIIHVEHRRLAEQVLYLCTLVWSSLADLWSRMRKKNGGPRNYFFSLPLNHCKNFTNYGLSKHLTIIRSVII